MDTCITELLYYAPENNITLLINYQFSSVAQSCPTLCGPMNRSMPGLPVHGPCPLPEFTQTQVHKIKIKNKLRITTTIAEILMAHEVRLT